MDASRQRDAMIQGQLRPNRIGSPSLIRAFQTVPREDFLPDALKSLAYTDQSIPLDEDRFLLSPLAMGFMIEAANLTPEDRVLDIGGGCGYMATLLTHLVKHVVVLDTLLNPFKEESFLLKKHGDLKEGCPKEGPYDAIFIEGAISEEPLPLLRQLKENGRLVYFERKKETVLPSLVCLTKTKKSHEKVALIEFHAPDLTEFSPKVDFIF